MAPPGGRFSGHNLSNPFAHVSGPLQQGPHIQQQQQQQHQQQQQQQHNLQHAAFGGANAGHNLNLFSHNQGNFQANAGIAGGMPGQALGAQAALGGVSGGTGLDGQEARMRFAHGAQLQEAAAGRGQDGVKGPPQIRDVWKGNLHHEMELLRALIDEFPYISMVSIISLSPQHISIFSRLLTFFSNKRAW